MQLGFLQANLNYLPDTYQRKVNTFALGWSKKELLRNEFSGESKNLEIVLTELLVFRNTTKKTSSCTLPIPMRMSMAIKQLETCDN